MPKKFVVGFAYRRSDGTVAADPDPFIRLLLVRSGDLLLNGGGGPGDGVK